MRSNHLSDVIATDIPQPVERAPLEIENDLTRRDTWMFAPLIAAVIAVPLLASLVLAISTWHLVAGDEASLSTRTPTTFMARWPDKDLPLVR